MAAPFQPARTRSPFRTRGSRPAAPSHRPREPSRCRTRRRSQRSPERSWPPSRRYLRRPGRRRAAAPRNCPPVSASTSSTRRTSPSRRGSARRRIQAAHHSPRRDRSDEERATARVAWLLEPLPGRQQPASDWPLQDDAGADLRRRLVLSRGRRGRVRPPVRHGPRLEPGGQAPHEEQRRLRSRRKPRLRAGHRASGARRRRPRLPFATKNLRLFTAARIAGPPPRRWRSAPRTSGVRAPTGRRGLARCTSTGARPRAPG